MHVLNTLKLVTHTDIDNKTFTMYICDYTMLILCNHLQLVTIKVMAILKTDP